MSDLTELACSGCDRTCDAERLRTVCDACGQPLLARYDTDRLAVSWDRESLAGRPPTMWRYRELAPIRDPDRVVSLGEPITPLVPLPRLGRRLGLDDLWLKDETRLPTATFKARGLAMAISRAVELGAEAVALPSAGNAAEAASVYAARAGLTCIVAMPHDAPIANQRICRAAGARVELIDGLISDAGRWVAEGVERHGWLDLSTFREPYRVEGKKTMGLELAEQFDWTLPDVIVYPTGGGTGLVGMWKAFRELQQIGWIGAERPRTISVQSEGCAPIVRAFHEGAEAPDSWENASTIAGGLRVPFPLAGRLILQALRESGGIAVAVSDDEIRDAMAELSSAEGVLSSPESAATLVAARRLAASGEIGSDERAVLFNCGTSLKHVDLLGDDAS